MVIVRGASERLASAAEREASMIGIRELMAAGALAGAVVWVPTPTAPEQPHRGADHRPSAEIVADSTQLRVGGVSATGVE